MQLWVHVINNQILLTIWTNSEKLLVSRLDCTIAPLGELLGVTNWRLMIKSTICAEKLLISVIPYMGLAKFCAEKVEDLWRKANKKLVLPKVRNKLKRPKMT